MQNCGIYGKENHDARQLSHLSLQLNDVRGKGCWLEACLGASRTWSKLATTNYKAEKINEQKAREADSPASPNLRLCLSTIKKGLEEEE